MRLIWTRGGKMALARWPRGCGAVARMAWPSGSEAVAQISSASREVADVAFAGTLTFEVISAPATSCADMTDCNAGFGGCFSVDFFFFSSYGTKYN